MEWMLLVLGGGCAAAAGRYVWFRRAARRRTALELEHIRRTAEADAIHFGEELARFGESPAARDLDAETRHDYQTALDAYESAKRAVDYLRSAESVRVVVDTLTSGRYALACVRARVAGRPLPERRTPCFFNPQHGPSTTEVVWTPRNGPTRRVSACAQDAARIRAGEDAPVYLVRYGEQQIPLWEPGAPIEPYRISFFASSGARAQVIGLRSELMGEGGGTWGNGLGDPKPRRPYD
ncbi:hypothetical protein [Kribbella steppae]|nr:hypothetical protein [Kribbella steppae]